MTIRVLHFLKTSVGASWALRQLRELVQLGVDAHVALPAGPMCEAYVRAGVKVHKLDTSLNVRNIFRNIQTFACIRALVDEVEPDILHSHFVANTLALRVALGKKHRIPRIFQVPGPLHLEHPFFRVLEISTAGERDFWIGSCEWTCDRYVRSGIDRSRVGLVYYGVDLPDGETVRINKLRKEYGVGDHCPVVGNVAYFYPPKRYLGQTVGLKGHEDLLQAVELLGRRMDGLTCFLIGGAWQGGDWYFEKVKKLAGEISSCRVVMTGFRSDIHEIYNDFDVAVHPSHSENVGGAVESLLHRIPTVTTAVGGFPDLVQPGVTGWLVPPRDPLTLSMALEDALRDKEKAERFAAAGRLRVEELMDVRKNAMDLLAYYEQIKGSGKLSREFGDHG